MSGPKGREKGPVHYMRALPWARSTVVFIPVVLLLFLIMLACIVHRRCSVLTHQYTLTTEAPTLQCHGFDHFNDLMLV